MGGRWRPDDVSLRLSRRGKLGGGPAPPAFVPPVPDPLVWFDATSEAYANGDPVTAATDRSGNSRNATGGSPPTFVTNVINGLSVYRFDGTNDMLQTPLFAMTQPLNLFILGKAALNGANLYFCDDRAGGNSLAMHKSSGDTLNIVGGGSLVGPALDTSFHVMSGLYNGASSVVRLDGGAGTTGNAGTAAPSGVTLGAYAAGIAFLNGDIVEYLLYGDLAPGEADTVIGYMADRLA